MVFSLGQGVAHELHPHAASAELSDSVKKICGMSGRSAKTGKIVLGLSDVAQKDHSTLRCLRYLKVVFKVELGSMILTFGAARWPPTSASTGYSRHPVANKI